MSDETTQNTTLPLQFGGKTYVSNINLSKNQDEFIPKTNTVVLDAPSINNVDKTQLYIDPVTYRIKLGQTNISEIKPDYSGTSKKYNVYLNTTLIQPKDDNTSSGSGGNTSQGKQQIKWVEQGQGILLDLTKVETPIISIDKNVVLTKDDAISFQNSLNEIEQKIDSLNVSVGNKVLSQIQFYELRQLLDVIGIVYSDNIIDEVTTLQFSSDNGSNRDILGFSFKYDETRNLSQINCLRIKTNSSLENKSYCSIRKCANFDQGAQTPPQTIFEFLEDSECLAVSNGTAILNNGCYEWYFSKPLQLKNVPTESNIYMVTFHSNKNQEWVWADRMVVNVLVSDESSQKTNLNFCWTADFNNIDVQPYASFCIKKPIGTRIKPFRN